MPIILPNRNPLAYPAGVAPGFDPTHVAARGCTFSGIATGSAALDILTGRPGVVTGTASTAGINAKAGPISNYPSNVSSGTYFSGKPTAADTNCTCQFIIVTNSNVAGTNENFFVTSGNGTAGLAIHFNATNFRVVLAGIAQVVSWAATLANSTAYYGVFSGSNTAGTWTYNQLLMNLNTGAKQTNSGSFAAGNMSAPDGTYVFGGWGTGNASGNCGLSSLSYSRGLYLPPQSVTAMADDLWSFWYPRRQYNFVGSVISAGNRGLFIPPNLTGLGSGGSFFQDRLAS